MRKFYALITFAALGMTAVALPHKGVVKHAPAGAPEVQPATEITEDGFTANWKHYAGADGYALFVWSREEVKSPARKTVLYEDFNLLASGSVIEPIFAEEMTSYPAEWGFTTTPDWTVSQMILAGGKIGGCIWTPYMDLRANGGKYTVELGIQGYAGQEVAVVATGSKEETKKILLESNGYNLLTLDFTNGDHETYLRIVDNGFPGDTEGAYLDKIAYLDDIEVFQNFQAGDDIYRLVEVADVDAPANSHTFESLPFRNGETRLYYELYAASFYFPDPDDDYNWETTYSPFSDKQEVMLKVPDGIAEIESAAAEDEAAEYFDTMGRRVSADALVPGIYLVKKASGVSKISIK